MPSRSATQRIDMNCAFLGPTATLLFLLMTAFSRLDIEQIRCLSVDREIDSMLFGDGVSMLAVTEARCRHKHQVLVVGDVTMLAPINQLSNERL